MQITALEIFIMSEIQTEILCRHPSCQCQPFSGEDYCSNHCQNADKQGAPEIVCKCGHPECQTLAG